MTLLQPPALILCLPASLWQFDIHEDGCNGRTGFRRVTIVFHGAGNDNQRWWQPVVLGGFYWPEGVARELTVENLAAVYKRLGYSACATTNFESGVEKVALYVEADGTPTHAARQVGADKWTSKLGELEDVEHATLECLESFYGKVKLVLSRPQRA